MDKSMIPILLALAAVVAAGAAMALSGGEEGEGGEAPSGYPPQTEADSFFFNETSVTMVLGDAIVFRTQLIAYHLTTEDYNSVFLYSTDENVCRQLNGSDMFSAVGIGECDVTASFGDQTATCHVTVIEKPIPVPVNPDGPEPSPVGPGAPADVPSVSGGSPAMEFYLELAPGGSKAIDVPSEYLSLLSMAQWSSSDPSVCTVTADSAAGTVTAVAHRAGECDLTASLGFYSAVCHVTVRRSL